TEPDSPAHPFTFDVYMLEEENRIVNGVSIGPVTRDQRQRQFESAMTYLMAVPLWDALHRIADGSGALAPEQAVALRLHPMIVDRIICQERWHQRECEQESAVAESEFHRKDEAETARSFAIAARRFELLKDDLGRLCKELGIPPERGPAHGRG